MLYVPNPAPDSDQFQILDHPEDPQTQIPQAQIRRHHESKKMFTHNTQSNESHDKPLSVLLQGFGDLVPQRPSDARRHNGSSATSNHTDRIDLSLLCFHTLKKVAKITIQWVDCLNLHLDFDRKSRVLKLFRFPSFCLLMCSNNHERTLLSQ